MAYAYVISANQHENNSSSGYPSARVDKGTLRMLSYKSDKVLRTLTNEKEPHLLDSDCFKSKEAIRMSKTTRKSKSSKGVFQRGSTWIGYTKLYRKDKVVVFS